MPRFALALMPLAGCFFDADYSRAHLRCDDGPCDAAVGSGSADARMAALTCGDPGMATGTLPGSTMHRTNLVSSLCGGLVYNGPDTVYTIDGPGAVTISITGSYAVSAYVLAACTAAPQTPTCEGNMAAQPAAPLTLTLTAGTHFVVVDGVNAGLSGTYTLTITR